MPKFLNTLKIPTTTNALVKTINADGSLSVATSGTDYLLPTGSGASLTSLNATQITSGTLPDARLSANVPLKAGGNTFTGNQQITPAGLGGVQVNRSLSGTGAGDYWGFGVANQAATDYLILGCTSSTYTTGGLFPWGGNSQPFLYYPSASGFKIGCGAGGTAALTFDGSLGATFGGALVAASLAGPGSGLTSLSATNLGSGTVAVARLGSSGTASSSTFLRGDNAWATPAGGGDMLTALVNTPVAITAATALSGTSYGKLHVCSGTSADYALTLPDPTGHAGGIIAVRMDAALTKFVTLTHYGSETIDGAATRVLWANETAILTTDGTHWYKLSGRSLPMIGSACASTNQTIPSSYSPVRLAIDTMIIDNSGRMVDTTNYRIYARRTSVYQVTLTVRFASLPNNIERLVGLSYLNSTGGFAVAGEIGGLTGAYPGLHVMQPVAIAAGDYIYSDAFTGYYSTSSTYGDGASDGCLHGMTEVCQW